MKKAVLVLLVSISIPTLLHAQQTKKWNIEAGPYIGIPAWTFHLFHSVGLGVDARIIRDLGNNFSGGGKITYAHFFGKDFAGFKAKGFNMMGLYATLQYAIDGKYVVGGDAGLGYSFAGGNSEAAFARTGYFGYQFKQQDHLITIAAYLNRTTPATYNIGIKSWFRF